MSSGGSQWLLKTTGYISPQPHPPHSYLWNPSLSALPLVLLWQRDAQTTGWLPSTYHSTAICLTESQAAWGGVMERTRENYYTLSSFPNACIQHGLSKQWLRAALRYQTWWLKPSFFTPGAVWPLAIYLTQFVTQFPQQQNGDKNHFSQSCHKESTKTCKNT